jgi:hypothetical protein
VSRAELRGRAITGIPRYPRYKTLIVASEPFVEQVVGVIRSMGVRISTHMLLRVPSQDQVATIGHHGTTGVMTSDRSQVVPAL